MDYRSLSEDFRSQIDTVLGEAIGNSRKVVLLDQPTHRNLGDTFIWQGELDTLKRLGKTVIYKAVNHRVNWDFLDRLDPTIPLLLHGGGNMGDVWLQYEEFRRSVIQRYPDRKIIILPQTLQYFDKAVLEETSRIYSAASDLTILSRTQKGIDEYGDYFTSNDLKFSPDMALGMDAIRCKKIKGGLKKPLVIQRDDKESKDNLILPHHSSNVSVGDWVFSENNQKLWFQVNKLNRIIISQKIPESIRIRTQNFQSDMMRFLNMRAAFAMFSGASVVVSNRLHAHIFASLLGIPNYISDNNYGKMPTIYNEYTNLFPNAQITPSLADSLKLANINL